MILNKITPEQEDFLAQRLDDVDLSVRSSNCLKSLEIKYLGELVQLSGTNLLRIQNFGRKSLNEIVALFATKNLRLGLSLPVWTPPAAVLQEAVVDGSNDGHEVSSSILDKLTSRQARFLAQKLEDVDLSVRTWNCLVHLKIKYVGELIQVRPSELLRIQGFGKKCLDEINALFSKEQLKLRLPIPDWTPQFVSALFVDKSPNEPTRRNSIVPFLSATQKAFLTQSLHQFFSSVRLSEFLKRESLKRVADLAGLPQSAIESEGSLGLQGLREIEAFLATGDLFIGMEMPEWNEAVATEWEKLYAEEIRQQQGRWAINPSGGIGFPPVFLEDELKHFARQIWNNASARNIEIVVRFFGLDGMGRRTLAEVGHKYEITRERVRQVTAQFARRVGNKRCYLPAFRWACATLTQNLPGPLDKFNKLLHERNISRNEFHCSGIASILELLGEEPFYEVATIAGVKVLANLNTGEQLSAIPAVARSIVSAFGCGHIEHVLDYFHDVREKDSVVSSIRLALDQINGIRWLDPNKEWFTIVDTTRNRLANVLRKLLSVSSRVTLSEARGAIMRFNRLKGFSPPRQVLREFCSVFPFCRIQGDYISASAPIDIADTLGETERCFYDVFCDHGPVMNSTALRAECTERGMNGNTFGQYIVYSPIICRLARETYALVGAEVPPGAVEDATKSGPRAPVLADSGWTDDGRVWISYRLNTTNLRTGVVSLPAGFSGIVNGQYFVQSPDAGSRSVVVVDNNRLTGLHRAISIRGGEPEDIIVVTFNLRDKTADIQFGDVAIPSDDKKPSVVALELVQGATSIDKNETSAIAIDGSIILGKEWQPISTAPLNREVEVRLEDSLGRYPLFFPCKLVPDRGWMNSQLEVPLPFDPVDWRNWEERSKK